jgi:chromosome segregation ATPase
MKESTIKMPVACRIPKELRQELETEAAENGQNLSCYLETLLANRHNVASADDTEAQMFAVMVEAAERAEALEAENAQLKEAAKSIQVQQDNERIVALKTQLAQTERQYQDLLQRHTSVKTERDALAKVPTSTLPKWWSPEHYNQTIPYMKELSSKHPDYSAEQLLLSAVAVAAANEENSFFVYTLKDFWRRNPHFLNLQTPVVTR